MRLAPRHLLFGLALVSLTYGETRVDVYNSNDMGEARDINEQYEMVLHANISLAMPELASSYYHSSQYVFTSADTSAPVNLSFYGEDDERGEPLHNCGATFQNLKNINFTHWSNKWADIGGGKKDYTSMAHGGVISAGDYKTILFQDNGAVTFSHITYDSSDWGATDCTISVFGGAIHVYNSDSGLVDFAGNESVTLQHISSINEHDSDFCYKDFYAYGGAIYTPRLDIRHTKGAVSLSNNSIHQGVCTDVEGVGQGGAAYIAAALNISATASNITLDNNSILVANRAEGGALYLAENSSSSLSDNLLHLQLRGNTVQAAADVDFNFAEDSLHADCEARGGAAYIGGELLIERNSGNITIESNAATADYRKVLENGRSEEHDNDPAYALGGAFFLASGAHLAINHNGTENTAGMGNVTFADNEVSTIGTSGGRALGGALYLSTDATLDICHNTGNVSFSRNKAAEGGAIYFSVGSSGSISGNGSVSFENNSATHGAGIYAAGTVSISGNGHVIFSGNEAQKGSAIYAASGSLVDIYDNNGDVKFTNNEISTGDTSTGAIHLCSGATLKLRDNVAVVFESGTNGRCVLYGESGSFAHLSGNKTVTISLNETMQTSIIQTAGTVYLHDNIGNVELNNNSALQASGAVFTLNGSSALLSVCGNRGSITAAGNYATETGGVIRAESGSHILICDNADISITGNSSRSGAAAIDSDGSIHIRNNAGRVIFANNGVYDDESALTTLRSLRADNAQISAATGYSVEFRDSILISPANEGTPALVLNADYKDSSGTTHKQGGDIIFTGADTINAKASVDAAASRHSKINGATTLLNGRLIVTQQAMLEGDSLSTTEHSGATVVLSQGGYLNQSDVNISTGTTLQAGDADTAILLASPPMMVETLQQLVEHTTVCGYFGGSTLTLQNGSSYAMYGGILDLDGGRLNLSAGTGAITLRSSAAPTLVEEEYVLLLFTGVNHLEYSEDIRFTYNGHEYGAEHLAYAANERAVYLRNLIIPEPATSTLCFLALAALISRRRR